MPMPAPRVAAGDALQAQPSADPGAVLFNSLQEIARTSRLKTAAAPGSAQPMQQWRYRPLVKKHTRSQNPHHQGARIEACLARRNHSSSSAA